MSKRYTEAELRAIGMDDEQVKAIMATYANADVEEVEIPVPGTGKNVVALVRNEMPRAEYHHDVEAHMVNNVPMVPTTIQQIASYKNGTIVELPAFADGQPFVARMTRPSMLALVKSGKIPNTLLNQATSLFANGAGALNNNGKNSTNVSELFDVIDVIVEAALLEPTLKDIRSVGMELTDDQLMAIFSYTQRGIKALEQFRTE